MVFDPRSLLPSYYAPVKDQIVYQKPSRAIVDKDSMDTYKHYGGNIDSLINDVIAAKDYKDPYEYERWHIQKALKSGQLTPREANDLINQSYNVQSMDNEMIEHKIDILNELGNHEINRTVMGLEMMPVAALASGIGGSLIGLNPMQSLATGIASASAIPIADKIMESPNLREYRATTGVRPAAAALTGILTALGLKVLSPQQDQELLDKGMTYAQQQPIQ